MLQVNTLEGNIQTVDATPSSAIRELKHLLVDQRPWEDCIDRKIGRAKILTDGLLADDDQTLGSSGILHADFNATVVFSRAELEAARAKNICEKGFVQVTLSPGIDSIAAGAFRSCDQAVVVKLPDSVVRIGQEAFLSCKKESLCRDHWKLLTSVSAFANCSSWANIELPDMLRYIGAYAFAACKSLRGITLPQSVTTLKGTGPKG